MADLDAKRPGEFTAFTQRVILVLIVGGLALLVWRISYALLLAFISILLAVLYRSAARQVSRLTRLPVRWSLLVVALLLILAAVLFFWLAVPRISEQVRQFLEALPGSFGQIKEALGRTAWGEPILESLSSEEVSLSRGFDLISRVTGYAMTVFDAGAAVILILFTTIFLAANPAAYLDGALSLVPRNRTDRFRQVIDKTADTLQHWLLGQLVSMAAVGLLVGLGLWIAGVPQPLLLGLIAGVLEFVPFVGPVTAAIPGVLLALSDGWTTALWALIVYILVAQIEGQVITPLVQRQAVHLPPAVVILAVVALGLLFGFLGVIIATPLTAVIMVWVKMLYVEDVLGKGRPPHK